MPSKTVTTYTIYFKSILSADSKASKSSSGSATVTPQTAPSVHVNGTAPSNVVNGNAASIQRGKPPSQQTGRLQKGT